MRTAVKQGAPATWDSTVDADSFEPLFSLWCSQGTELASSAEGNSDFAGHLNDGVVGGQSRLCSALDIGGPEHKENRKKLTFS